MELFIRCKNTDTELIDSTKMFFDDVEVIKTHSFGELSTYVILFVPIVSLTVQTIDFFMTHFANSSNRIERYAKIDDNKKEYSFKGFSREEIIALIDANKKIND